MTPEQRDAFFADQSKNPITGRRILFGGPTHRRLLRQAQEVYASKSIVLTREQRDAFAANPRVNPLTGRTIAVNGPTHRKLQKAAAEFDDDHQSAEDGLIRLVIAIEESNRAFLNGSMTPPIPMFSYELDETNRSFVDGVTLQGPPPSDPIAPPVSDEIECSICFTAVDKRIDLTCGHTFHPKCYASWFDAQVKACGTSSCPLCRKTASFQDMWAMFSHMTLH